MSKDTLHLSSIDSSIWNTPGWYRALTLTERVAASSDMLSSPNPQELKAAQDRLELWKKQTPFDADSFFADRLRMDTLTEEKLLALLAESDESLHARLSTPPDWLVKLALLLTHMDDEVVADDDVLATLLSTVNQVGSQAFLRPFQPLLQWGITRLQEGIQQIHAQANKPPFDEHTLLTLFVAYLPGLISPKLDRTLVLEMHAAKLRGLLQGKTPQERFESYIQLQGQPEALRLLLEEYCVLARQLILTIERWTCVSLELVRRLVTDWQEIQAVFAPGSDPGFLTRVSGGAGDLHRGGRSVSILEFTSGLRIVYKPKALAIDQHFQDLLSWLNAHGQQPRLRTLKVLDRGEYGWTEFIIPATCQTREEVERFYERQGSYIALCYALEATDMHYENILAAGEHPMLVDLETLFHPSVIALNSVLSGHPTYHAFSSSVLHIGLLPCRLYATDEAEGLDVSGLGGETGQLSPFTVPRWEDVGTDEMRLIRKKVETGGKENRPTLNGNEVQALDYYHQIIQGFITTYRLLMAWCDELCQELLHRFANDEVRFLARATRMYALLLSESFHPNVLRDGLKRERTFDRLWFAVRNRPYLARLIAAERGDLQQGDIPLFTTTPGSCDLLTSRGECIQKFFVEPGLDAVRRRLIYLNEEDLVRQSWMIQAAFTSVSAAVKPEIKKKMALLPSQTIVTRERLLQAACAVGDQICKLAIQREGAIGWLGVARSADMRWDLQPADTSLYHGNVGIALFLAYLGRITGEQRYADYVRSTLTTIHYDLEQVQKYPRLVDIGGFTGLGSPIYFFAHLGALWNEPDLFHAAESLLGLLAEKIPSDSHLSILSGSAGAIACLLTLYAVAPSDHILQIARLCGEHLLAQAQPMKQGIGWQNIPLYKPLTGFSNGAAGIGYGLLRLADVSGEERFRQGALEAFSYERSLFSLEQQNWPVLFTEEAQEDSFRMSWGYGAPGIGLARLGSLQFVDDISIREEIAIALRTTLAEGFGYEHGPFGPNHSISHGDFGNLETILVATQVLHGREEYQSSIERLTAMLLDSIDTYGWTTGVPLNVETPGLMIGLSGIGYELLRLAEPEKVPSVLLLAPPSEHSYGETR